MNAQDFIQDAEWTKADLQKALEEIKAISRLLTEIREQRAGLLQVRMSDALNDMERAKVIQMKVAEAYGITVEDIKSSRRPDHISFPRQVAMYLCRETTKLAYRAIGEVYGGRDHVTVIHGCRAVKNRMETEPSTREKIEKLKATL